LAEVTAGIRSGTAAPIDVPAAASKTACKLP
jgi:hypothetical protein